MKFSINWISITGLFIMAVPCAHATTRFSSERVAASALSTALASYAATHNQELPMDINELNAIIYLEDGGFNDFLLLSKSSRLIVEGKRIIMISMKAATNLDGGWAIAMKGDPDNGTDLCVKWFRAAKLREAMAAGGIADLSPRQGSVMRTSRNAGDPNFKSADYQFSPRGKRVIWILCFIWIAMMIVVSMRLRLRR